ncbi:Kinesin-like protein [Drosera capensis]
MASFSMASVVEDVLRKHGGRLSDVDLASRKAEEASLRRYEAAGWLRKMVGVVAGKDLPAEPSEEHFRIGLRSGIILCNVLNKIQPGAVPKVVEAPNDSVLIPDGAALMAYQYFENVKNFLHVIEEMGLPPFHASNLEQGGKSARIVNCVLALKSYNEWKQAGGSGSWKYGGNVKPMSTGKPFVPKNSEPSINSISRTSSASEKSLEPLAAEGDLSIDDCMNSSHSLSVLVRTLLADKKQEEIPLIVESLLSKVMEEFERQAANQIESIAENSRLDEMPEVDEKPASPVENEEDEFQPSLNNEGSETDVCERQALSEQQPEDMSLLEHQHHVERLVERQQNEEVLLECQQGQGMPQLEQDEPRLLEQQRKEHLLEKQQQHIQVLKFNIYTTKESIQDFQRTYLEEFNFFGKHMCTLAHAASKYRKVLEENCKLYNQVQDLKGNIRVYCRVRPFLPGEISQSNVVDHIEAGNITVINPSSKYGKEGKKSFTFNKVFGPSATQAEVFADTQPLIRSILDGYNVCIFAYGQTGSGKTYTMSGPNDLTEETFGVNYRTLNDLFLLAEQRKDTFSYENGINVPDANRLPVSSTTDVINLMNLGQKNRAVSATAMNERSSRSHSCLTVHVQGRDLTSGAIIRGCMHLVDLAGSERVEKSEVTGDRLKEAVHINKSLSALGDVIASLAQKNPHVPYRNSKLTQLLQDALGGQAKTLMFVHISPELEAIGETLSTLKFAERVSSVELGAAKVNKDMTEVKELKEQIASLKAALAKREEELEQVSSSVLSSNPETLNLKSTSSSPSVTQWRPVRDTPGGRRLQMENVGSIKNSASKPRRRSLDPHDLAKDNASWRTVNGHKEDETDMISGEWIDKVVVKHDTIDMHSVYGNSEDETQSLPEANYQGLQPYETLTQPLNGYVPHRRESQDSDFLASRSEPSVAEDLDELELATNSDSSELDFHLHGSSLPRASSVANGLSSKPKKSQHKPLKNTEMRSFIPAPPTRRLSNGTSLPSVKNGRHAVYVKRKAANAK